jgi:hypothetical protein
MRMAADFRKTARLSTRAAMRMQQRIFRRVTAKGVTFARPAAEYLR